MTVVGAAAASAQPIPFGDGKRAVDVPRFGIHVRVPQAWDLVDWSRDDTAFVVDLPQDAESSVGHVVCTLAAAAGDLEAYRARFAAEAALAVAKPNTAASRRTLRKNEIVSLTPPMQAVLIRKFARRLDVEWELESSGGRCWYERRVLLIGDGMLYTFSLDSDEAHYEAYALDFVEMLAGAKIEPPPLPVVRLADGRWMQQELRFALKLPAAWRPFFAPSDRELFYAVGEVHGSQIDELSVRATPPQAIDWPTLPEKIAAEIKRYDDDAEVTSRIVAQGRTTALETLVRTRSGGTPVTRIERRFQSETRNYEVRLTCATAEFERCETELRKLLDGFVEIPPDAEASET